MKIGRNVAIVSYLLTRMNFYVKQIIITTAVMYNCTVDGGFEPKQCIVNAQTMNLTEQCFCVFVNGTEIVGTRKPEADGQSVFCGGKLCK